MTNLNQNTIDIRPYQRAKKYIIIGNSIGRILAKVNEARIRRQTIRELQGLTDAQLEDIGIPRYDIRRAVNARLIRSANTEQGGDTRPQSQSNSTQIRSANYARKLAA